MCCSDEPAGPPPLVLLSPPPSRPLPTPPPVSRPVPQETEPAAPATQFGASPAPEPAPEPEPVLAARAVLLSPPPAARQTMVTMVVPPGATAGQVLTLETGGGNLASVRLPEGAGPLPQPTHTHTRYFLSLSVTRREDDRVLQHRARPCGSQSSVVSGTGPSHWPAGCSARPPSYSAACSPLRWISPIVQRHGSSLECLRVRSSARRGQPGCGDWTGRWRGRWWLGTSSYLGSGR